jgi:hypothetical protein
MVIPPSLHQFRDQNGDLLVRTRSLYVQNVIDNRRKNVPITRGQYDELRCSHASFSCRLIDEPAPFLTKYCRTVAAVYVHGANMRPDDSERKAAHA